MKKTTLYLFAFFITFLSFAQTKRALIIAISNYTQQSSFQHPDLQYWDQLNSVNDIPLVKNALLAQGFKEADITVITDSQATKKGILNALDKLIAKSGKGDIVIIHYSGHGEQIEDDDTDEEADGKDETIVAWDAVYVIDPSDDIYAKATAGYLRDDVFGEKIIQLRNKLGKGGDVLVTLDACYSGSGTRGGKEHVRGNKEPMLSRSFNKKKKMLEDTAGIFKETSREKLNADAASFVVISAAQAFEKNNEYEYEMDHFAGPLSYALSQTLNTLGEAKTYRTLFAQIEDLMLSTSTKQKPALEGDGIDRELFAGKFLLQKPFVTGTVSQTDKLLVELKGGTIVGIKPGSVISFYPNTVIDPAGKTPLDKGVVQSSGNFSSTVLLTKPNPALEGKTIRAFVTELNYTSKKIKLGVDSLDATAAAVIKDGLKDFQLTDFNAPYDLYIGKSDMDITKWALRYVASGMTFTEIKNVNDVEELKSKLRDFDRSRFLKSISASQPGLSAKVSLVFKDDKGNIDNLKMKSRTKLGRLELKKDDVIYPVIINTGKTPFYINIVDIQPDGKINPVLPNKNLKDINGNPTPIYWQECKVMPGKEWAKKISFKIAPPYGEETFKVFLSSEPPLDLEEILTSNGSSDSNSRGSSGVLNSLAKIFKDSDLDNTGTRGAAKVTPSKDGTIFNLNFKIVPK